MRGTQGTPIQLTIEREGEKAPLVFSLMREEIPVHNVSYSGFLEPGIAYVRLERFYRTTGSDMRSTLKDLKAKGDVKGVILDLRGNPGGLLEMAVEVVTQFVPDSTLVVSTRGRRADSEHKYFSSEMPMLPDVPLLSYSLTTTVPAQVKSSQAQYRTWIVVLSSEHERSAKDWYKQ